MTHALYSLLMWLLQPWMRRKLRRRARAEPLYGQAMAERFGHYASAVAPPTVAGLRVWVHAVSLGETRAAAVLVAQLRQALPGLQLLLTHGTATGRAQGQSLLQTGDIQVWQPWDTPAVVDRFLRHFRPDIGLLMETEIWPNLVRQCARARVPLCLVNARLSAKSLRQAERLAWLAHPAYQGLRAVWAQSDADAQRLRQLGAPVQAVLGNFKYDATPDAAQCRSGRAWRAALGRPLLLLASAREGEEQMLLQCLRQSPAAAQVQWLIVPRHPQRFDAVAQLCAAQGLTLSRRSQWGAGPQPADIWLGDSMGEMALYYAMADAALLGGSFAPLGGQNLIEAAACACPVFMGPHTFNFSQAAALAEQAGAAFSLADMEQAVAAALALVQQAQALQAARSAALAFSAAHQGAAARTAAAVRQLLLG